MKRRLLVALLPALVGTLAVALALGSLIIAMFFLGSIIGPFVWILGVVFVGVGSFFYLKAE